MNPLKPCPFDGHAMVIRSYHGGLPYLRCGYCGAQTRYFDNESDAEAAWNRRVADPETVALMTQCRNFITSAPFGKDQDEDDVLDEIEDWLQAHASEEEALP